MKNSVKQQYSPSKWPIYVCLEGLKETICIYALLCIYTIYAMSQHKSRVTAISEIYQPLPLRSVTATSAAQAPSSGNSHQQANAAEHEHHLADTFPFYLTPCSPKMRITFMSIIEGDHHPALWVAGVEDMHSKTEHGTPEGLADPQPNNTSAEQFW